MIKKRVNLVEKIGEAVREYQYARNELLAKTFDFCYSNEKVYVQVDDNKFI